MMRAGIGCFPNSPMPNLNEAALSKPVSAWLESRGLRVFAEVPHYGSAIDLVGADVERPFIVGVELKTGFTQKLFYQALSAQYAVDESWACAPTKPTKAKVARARQLGIGLLRVQDGRVFIVLEPERTELSRKLKDWHRNKLIKRLATHPEGGVGGMPNLKGEGPAVRVRDAVLEYMAEHPNAGWQEIFNQVPNHYASFRSMAGVMNNRFGVGLKLSTKNKPPANA